MQSWRLVNDLDRQFSASEHMARDIGLLESVARGAPSVLRFYQWHVPALSLGHFQSDDDVDRAACRKLGVDVVRRPTGGRALLHGREITYAVALPRPKGAAGRVDAVYHFVASGLIAGLARLGIDAAVGRSVGPPGPACFAAQQGADLRVGERKLCGSAQVRRHGVVLQHGSIRLRRLEFDETDVLRLTPAAAAAAKARLQGASVTLGELGITCGLGEVAEAFRDGFASTLDLHFIPEVDVEARASARDLDAVDLSSTSRLAAH